MEDLTKYDELAYDELAFNKLMSLVSDCITSCDGIDGACDKLLAAAATLICDNKSNFEKLLSFAMDSSTDMSDILTTVMIEKYNMINAAMDIDDMKKFLVEKDMMYPVFKAYFLDHDAPEQLRMIKELFDLTCVW